MANSKSAVYRLKRRAIGMINPHWRSIARDVINMGVGDAAKKVIRSKRKLARTERGREVCEQISNCYGENREQLLKDFPL